MAALIAVSAVYRSPLTARQLTVGGVTGDGAITSIWGSCYAIPPPLRRALAAQRQQLTRAGVTSPAILYYPEGHGAEYLRRRSRMP